MTTCLPTSLLPADHSRFDESANTDIWLRIKAMAKKNLGATAIRDGETNLSYQQLLTLVDVFVLSLSELQKEATRAEQSKDRPAVIVMRNSWQQVIAMLAMLKAGQVFLCLDPRTQSKRLETVLLEVQALILVHDETCSKISDTPLAKINTANMDWQRSAPLSKSSTNKMVCQILTSGSTGTPKMIAYSQEIITRDVAVRSNCLGFAPSDRFAQLLNSTSLPIMTMFLALMNGAQLVLGKPPSGANIQVFADWVAEHSITVLRFTPTLLRLLCLSLSDRTDASEKLASVRLCSTGGEALYKDDVDSFRKLFPSSAVLINHLAATEYRVACQNLITFDIPISDHRVSVGEALPGVEVYILDKDNRLLSDGEVGRVAISSPVIAPQFKLTLVKASDGIKKSVYLSEDLGFLDTSGNLVPVGRIGQDRKINGARVNLSEIDSVLAQMEGVQSATTFDSSDIAGQTKSQLVTAIHYIGNKPPSLADARKLIYSSLSFFGLPNKLILVDEPARTKSGKLDRQRLAKHLSEKLEQENR